MRVCVHGMGQLGQLTAALFAGAGHSVVGYSLDAESGAKADGETVAPGTESTLTGTHFDDVVVTDGPVTADYHSVCVSAPYDDDRRRAVMACIDQAARRVADTVRDGDTVALSSTVPPGTTAGRFYRTVSRTGKTPERDFFLGYVPAGDPDPSDLAAFRRSDWIIGGVGPDSAEVLAELYRSVTDKAVAVAPDSTTAEFAWLARLAKRDLEVAYANQLNRIADDYRVDAREAIELANGDTTDIAEPGLAGSGIAPEAGSLFLGQWSEDTTLLRCIKKVNERTVQRVVSRLSDALVAPHSATVAVLGATSGPGIFGGEAVARRLNMNLATPEYETDGGTGPNRVRTHNPVVTESSGDRVSLERTVDGADAVVIAAQRERFTELTPELLDKHVANRLVVDAVGTLDEEQWIDAGFRYIGV